jgi:glycosyltransferase involved in cell wall biosynthesis
VLSQDYPDLELIVVDGGSTDGSVEIIRSYSSRLAWWVSEPDHGQADAINKGFRQASGEIVSWLNSDDLYCPGTLDFVGRWFNEQPDAQVLYGGTVMVDDQDQIIDAVWPTQPDPNYLYYVGFDISQQSVFWRRDCLDTMGLLDSKLQYSLDYDFLLRLLTRHQVDWAPRFLGVFRRHKLAKSSTMLATSHRENALVRERYLSEFSDGLPRGVHRVHCRLRRLIRLANAGAGRYLAFKALKRIGIRLPASFWLAQHPNALAIQTNKE